MISLTQYLYTICPQCSYIIDLYSYSSHLSITACSIRLLQPAGWWRGSAHWMVQRNSLDPLLANYMYLHSRWRLVVVPWGFCSIHFQVFPHSESAQRDNCLYHELCIVPKYFMLYINTPHLPLQGYFFVQFWPALRGYCLHHLCAATNLCSIKMIFAPSNGNW